MTTLEAVTGEVIRPDHPEYEQARRIHNGMIDKRPAVIVRCRDARDVASAIAYARAEGLDRMRVLIRQGIVVSSCGAEVKRLLAETVRRDLRDLKPRDMIDLQSFIWVQGSDEYEE